MAELKPLFVDVDNIYGPDELGLPYRDIVGEGYVTGLAVSQRGAGANLSVDVAAGAAWVQGDTDTSGQPTYRCRNDAVVNLGITPDASNPRNVIVVAEVLDDTFDGGGSFLWRLRAVHGTAAASPADPATPTSAIRLARVSVTAADADITDAQITDLRAPANFGGGNIKLWAKGADIASAATIAVTHPFHDVTGTTNITSITAQPAGFVVTLQFDGVLTVTDGSNLKIGGNFTTAAESTITLVCDGTNWYELARSPITTHTQYYTLIADSTLGAPAANFDVQNIAATYAALEWLLYGRLDTTATFDYVVARFNNDSANNYDYQRLTGAAATVAAAEVLATSGAAFGELPDDAAGVAANKFGVARATVPHYAGTANHKIVTAHWADPYNTTTGTVRVGVLAAGWRSAAAISRVTVLGAAGNLKTGSRLTLYGLGV